MAPGASLTLLLDACGRAGRSIVIMVLGFAQVWHSHVRRPVGGPLGSAFWGLEPGDEVRVLAVLRAGDDPEAAPNGAWAGVVERGDGSVAATASTTFPGGLYWSWDEGPDGGRLLISVAPAPIVAARRGATGLDVEYLRAHAVMTPPGDRTPYRGIGRIPAGITAVWRVGSRVPRLVEWSGPAVWPAEATLEGPEVVERYVEVFDRAVAALTVEGRPIAATMSGGLDSTFVVASLVRFATRDNPVQAFCHAPHPDAAIARYDGWEADDFPVAAAMQQQYPGVVRLHQVVNTEGTLALDVAADYAERSWLPAVNPGNLVWIDQISRRARDIGADRLHTGGMGNMAFSPTPSYAVGHYLRRHDAAAVRACLVAAHGQGESWPQVWRSQVVPLVVPNAARRLKARWHGRPGEYADSVGVRRTKKGRPFVFDREAHLRLIAGGTGLAAALGPLPDRPLLVDPFTDRDVAALAAAITPLEWLRGPAGRGFARRAAKGRLPDSIRLRTRRGGQAMDAWWAMRHQQDRYISEAQALASSPVVGDWIDENVIRERIDRWEWGTPNAPPLTEIIATDRILSLAAFTRMTEGRLRSIRTDAARRVRDQR